MDNNLWLECFNGKTIPIERALWAMDTYATFLENKIKNDEITIILILEDGIPVKAVDSMTKFHLHDSKSKEKTWLSFKVE